MGGNKKTALSLGLPGQADGLPTVSDDRGDEVQRRFAYQWAIGMLLLAAGLSKKKPYEAIWCEHHEDLLVEGTDGTFEANQVKTLDAENAMWKLNNVELLKAITRFADLEDKYGSAISVYGFYSNAKPYVPGTSATKPETLRASPERLKACCSQHASPALLPEPYQTAFNAVVAATAIPPVTLHRVLTKLEFHQGPALRGFEDLLATNLATLIPECAAMPVNRLFAIRDELMNLVERAHRLSVPVANCFLSVLAANGKPQAELRAKRISIEEASLVVSRSTKNVFRYADTGQTVSLGHATGQKETLRRKMEAGYVSHYFEPLWMQAIAAEQRLMEQASEAPEQFEKKAMQLESVVLVECKNAEASSALEADERRRGAQILTTILDRCEHLARNEPLKVENEPKETLVGLAGLLSGECRFAWGALPKTWGG